MEVGSVWLEVKTGRRVKILSAPADDVVAWWTYIDNKGNPEPHGYESANGFNYDDWFQHCCEQLDFVLFGRFKPVTEETV